MLNFYRTSLVPCSDQAIWSRRENKEQWRTPTNGENPNEDLLRERRILTDADEQWRFAIDFWLESGWCGSLSRWRRGVRRRRRRSSRGSKRKKTTERGKNGRPRSCLFIREGRLRWHENEETEYHYPATPTPRFSGWSVKAKIRWRIWRNKIWVLLKMTSRIFNPDQMMMSRRVTVSAQNRRLKASS